MKTMTKTTELNKRKVLLSTLWIFAMFNYVYADILTLYFNPVLQKQATQQLLSGSVGSVHITQGFVLVGAIVLETAIAMVLLSRVLPYRANRWANIIAGVIQTAAVAFSLTGPLYWNLFYVFFSTIEIACTVFIVWYAWTWPHPEGVVLTSAQSSVYEQGERDERASHAHADE
jgi:Ni,Fe-hydrogenase I cytochrome b subunit